MGQLCAFMCVMFLFQAVAFAAGPPPPDPAASPENPFDPAEPPSLDPGASERIRRAHASCYETVTHVPIKCAQQFIRALFNGRSVKDVPITAVCCHQLACVRELQCVDVLCGVCEPPMRGECLPPETPPPAVAMARVSTATAGV